VSKAVAEAVPKAVAEAVPKAVAEAIVPLQKTIDKLSDDVNDLKRRYARSDSSFEFVWTPSTRAMCGDRALCRDDYLVAKDVDASFLSDFVVTQEAREANARRFAMLDADIDPYIQCEMVIDQLRKLMEHAWRVAVCLITHTGHNVMDYSRETLSLKKMRFEDTFKAKVSGVKNQLLMDEMNELFGSVVPRGDDGEYTVYKYAKWMFISIIQDVRNVSADRGSAPHRSSSYVNAKITDITLLIPLHGHTVGLVRGKKTGVLNCDDKMRSGGFTVHLCGRSHAQEL
jgi:hypothetical protein